MSIDLGLEANDRRNQLSVESLVCWYFFRDEIHFGPYTADRVKDLIKRGWFSSHHFLWRPGMTAWVRIREIEVFNSYVKTGENLNLPDYELQRILEAESLLPDLRSMHEDFSSHLNGLGSILSPRFEVGKGQDGQHHSIQNAENGATPDQPGTVPLKPKSIHRRAAMTLAAILLVGGLTFVFATDLIPRFRWQNLLQGLQQDQVQSLLQVATHDRGEESAWVAFRNPNSSEPIAVIATGLKEGAKVRVQLIGIPDTLLNYHRIERSYELEIDAPLFELPPLRMTDGRYLPPGEYRVQVSCTNCGAANPYGSVLFERHYFLGGAQDSQYQNSLRLYHRALREQARLELDELEQLLTVLQSQFQESIAHFSRWKERKLSQGAWQGFSSEWSEMQGTLQTTFQQLDDLELSQSLYYLPLYEMARSTTQNVSELQKNLNRKVIGNLRGNSESQLETAQERAIHERLQDLGRKISKARLQFEDNSQVLPSRAGL